MKKENTYKDKIIELYESGMKKYHITKRLNLYNNLVNETILEYENSKKGVEYFNVNELDCWICNIKN